MQERISKGQYEKECEVQKKEYEEMYAMINPEASGNVSPEDFIKRNSAIYEGIAAKNVEMQILSYDKKKLAVTYHASLDTAAGKVTFENKAFFFVCDHFVWINSKGQGD